MVPSLEDVPILAELTIRVALIACFLCLAAIKLLDAGKKGLVAVPEVNAMHESFGRAASNEIRGSNEVDVPDLVFIQSAQLNLAEQLSVFVPLFAGNSLFRRWSRPTPVVLQAPKIVRDPNSIRVFLRHDGQGIEFGTVTLKLISESYVRGNFARPCEKHEQQKERDDAHNKKPTIFAAAPMTLARSPRTITCVESIPTTCAIADSSTSLPINLKEMFEDGTGERANDGGNHPLRCGVQAFGQFGFYDPHREIVGITAETQRMPRKTGKRRNRRRSSGPLCVSAAKKL